MMLATVDEEDGKRKIVIFSDSLESERVWKRL
jgi:hypothetical protein